MRHAARFRFAALALAAGGLCGSAASQMLAPPSADQPVSTPAELPDTLDFEQDHRRRMTVPIRIGGKGPYSFVVDTGAERTVVSNELARHLALEPGRPVRMHSMTGVDAVATAIIPELKLSRKRISEIHAPVLRQAHLGAAGILGTDTLQSHRVDFDFARQTMSISASRENKPRFDPNTIVVTARSRFGRLILVDAAIEGEKVTVVLDTGSEVTIGNQALRRKLELKRKLRTTVPVGLVSVTGAKLVADYTYVNKIRLGNMFIENMPIGFVEVHPFAQLKLTDQPAMLLGMDALQLFAHVSVDFAQRKVSFLPPDLSWWNVRVAGGSAVPTATR